MPETAQRQGRLGSLKGSSVQLARVSCAEKTDEKDEEAIAQVNSKPKPLALYIFSNDKALQNQVLSATSSGGVCINDVILHTAIWGMPFGGVGDSGIGAYHGQNSFHTLSHHKSVLKKPFWIDLDWRYPPYADKLEFFKKMISLS